MRAEGPWNRTNFKIRVNLWIVSLGVCGWIFKSAQKVDLWTEFTIRVNWKHLKAIFEHPIGVIFEPQEYSILLKVWELQHSY
jgi:hypothetical protein